MNISSIGQNYYQNYATENKKVSGKEKFALEKSGGARELSKAEEMELFKMKTDSSVWAGDMVIPQPPNYSGFTYDSSISGKSKEEMSMDEYKQWFMNETAQMPVSAWVRSTIVGGSLTITEECFERMKNDPEWENTVLGMVRNMYSVNGIMGAKAIGYQVIGASPEQCHGEGIPVKDRTPFSPDNEKSWWEKRHERMKELMEEQEKEAVKKAAATAYEANISAFSRSVAGN